MREKLDGWKTSPRPWEGIDLRERGIREVPLLGLYRFRSAQPALVTHQHPGHMEICYLAGGDQVYRTGQRDYVLKPGDLFVTRADEEHSSGGNPQGKGALNWIQVRTGRTAEARFLDLPPTLARPLLKGLRHMKRCHFPALPEAIQAFDALQAEARCPDSPLNRLRIRSALINLLTAVVASEYSETTMPQAGDLNRVLDYIESHLDEPLSVPDLARVASLSVPWFQTRFRAEMGMPPGEYALRRRVRRAEQLLREGGRTVTDVAFELGFSSSQYFATAYRRYTGRQPRETRPR